MRYDPVKQGEKKLSAGHSVLSAYISSLQNYPQLGYEAMVEEFKIFNAGGPESERAKKKLIESNLRLVVSIANQYKKSDVPLEDLIQEGSFGLMKAVDRFDHARGYRFSTYATWWIRQSINQYVLNKRRLIRLPAHANDVQRKLIKATEDFRKEMGFDPSPEELATLTGASETVMNATVHSTKGIVSLHEPCKKNGGGTGEFERCYEHRIMDESADVDPFKLTAKHELIDIIKGVIAELSPKETAILRLRFGFIADVDETDYQVTDDEYNAISSGKGLTDE